MNSLGLAIFFVAVAAASAGLHAGIVAGVGTPAVISGPSGAVIRSGVAHGGYLAGGLYGAGYGAAGAIIAPATAAGAVIAPGLTAGAVIAPGVGLYGHGLLGAGSGYEGQYIPDYTEKLYDDGSYKPYLYGH